MFGWVEECEGELFEYVTYFAQWGWIDAVYDWAILVLWAKHFEEPIQWEQLSTSRVIPRQKISQSEGTSTYEEKYSFVKRE